ncbi:MAG: lipid II flippase MurJ [Bacillota bacterium]|nr:lipid II flippase MurJ [Bacillota bacterium]
MEEKDKKSASNTIKLLIFFNLLLAFVAFIKDIILASYFGTSSTADAINLAFFLPDMLGNNLIGAAVAVSTIPILTKLSTRNNLLILNSTIQTFTFLIGVGTLCFSVLLLFFSGPLFYLFHVNGPTHEPIVLHYFFIMLPIIIISPIWQFGSSILQSKKKFVIPAITPVLFNLLVLIGLLFCQIKGVRQDNGGKIYSFMITFAIFIICFLTWFSILREKEIKWSIKSIRLKGEVKAILPTFCSYALILSFSQLALLFERFFAGSLETGTIAALSYAYRISQFPIWVFVAAINTFILPTISSHLENRDFSSFKSDLVKSFLFVIIISGVLSLFLVILSHPLLSLLLVRGNFTLQSVNLTSEILKGYSLSIVGQSLYVFCTRYYVAEGKMRVPLLTGLLGSCLNICLLYFFVPQFGAVGIGYAVSVSSTLSGAFLLSHFYKRLINMERKGEVSIE